MADSPGSSASHQTDSEDSHTFTARGISELALEGEVRTAPCLPPYGKCQGSRWRLTAVSRSRICC